MDLLKEELFHMKKIKVSRIMERLYKFKIQDLIFKKLFNVTLEMGTTAVALHKQHRELMHSGDLVRVDTSEDENSFGIVAANQQEALFSYALLNSSSTTAMGRLRLRGLDANRLYTLSIIWPSAPSSTSSSILDVINGSVVSGDALMNFGLQLPIMQPTSLLVFHLTS